MKCILNYKNVNPLRNKWCSLLNRYRWTYFVTLTFKDIPKTFTAQNRIKRFLNYIAGIEKRDIAYYACMELTRIGTPHFHLLMGNLEGLRYSEWSKWWFTRYGYITFKVYDPGKGAIHYLTKYVIKDSYETGWYEVKGLESMDQLNLDLKNK